MKVSVFGSGYVGLVTGACLAEVGNQVVCVDVDQGKIDLLNRGGVPIFEPGLDDLIQRNRAAGRLTFTTAVEQGVEHGLLQFIAVGTPPDEDGSADLQHVLTVARSIGAHMNDYKIIVDKSTVPVGTADRVRAAVGEALAARGVTAPFDVVSNPEFLKEGAAIDDFMRPDRVVIGTDNPQAAEHLRQLYTPFTRSRNRLLVMDVRSAELTKYAANAMLAAKISFMNELANIAERVGADIESVRTGIGADPRIGYHFIYPGAGYGGSCFPKDVKALAFTAKAHDYAPALLDAVESVNLRQKNRLFEKIHAHFDGKLAGKTFALWGLAFKPNTDDMRDAPSRVLLAALWQAGARVQAYDPAAMDEARRIFGDRDDLVYRPNCAATLEHADGLIVITEWLEFRSVDLKQLKRALNTPVLFDGRNLYHPASVEAAGLAYYGIGRGR